MIKKLKQSLENCKIRREHIRASIIKLETQYKEMDSLIRKKEQALKEIESKPRRKPRKTYASRLDRILDEIAQKHG